MLRHPLADCENCTLNVEGASYVPSSGPAEADYVIVGEAPGYQEARTGKPFTGPSGKLLDAVLHNHGIERNNCFITNVCLCRPATNRTPTKQEVRACSSRLLAECSANPRKAIIALGGTAASAIAGRPVQITKQRIGPAKKSDLYPFAKFVSTFHPAYILRAPTAFPQLVDDIGKVNSDANVSWEPPTYRVFDTEPEACTALQELHRRLTSGPQRIVVDIEVGTEKDFEFNHPDQYSLLCVGLGYGRNRVAVIGETALQSTRVRSLLCRLLEHTRVRITAHNGKFDLAGLRPIGARARLSYDTMLASYVLDERAGTHGLKYLAVEKLGAPQYDLEIHKYVGKGESYANIPRDILYKYNAYDVACTWLLQDIQEATLTDQLRKVHDFLVCGSTLLMELELSGIKVDREYLHQLQTEYEERMDDLRKLLQKWVDNPNSPKQVSEALNDTFSTKVATTNAETLTALMRKSSGDLKEFCRLMLLWRREAKLYGTYIKGIRRRLYKGRIHPTFLLHGTTTGRLACRNPNLQNVPRESSIRRMYVPEEGNTFVQADYRTIELRVVATLAQDSDLAELLNPERDIHNEVAERFFGPVFTKDQRVRAKAVVYGLTYGRSAFDLANEFEIPQPAAQQYLDTFFGMIPSTVKWREEIKQKILHTQDDLVSPFGRHRRFWLITDTNKHDVVKEGLAFLPQSTASDINLAAAYRLQQMGYNVKLLVHDSTLIECPQEDADRIAIIMREVMEKTAVDLFTDFVPFPVDVKKGQSWGDV